MITELLLAATMQRVEYAPAPMSPPAAVTALACRELQAAGTWRATADATGPSGGVPAWGLWLDPYAGAGNAYLVGHNPGALSWLPASRIGDCLDYGGHRWRVVQLLAVGRLDVWVRAGSATPLLTLQTCTATPALNSRVLVVRAVPW